MNETLEIIQSEFAQASFETFEMVLISMIAAAILGTILGLVLHLASNPIFYKNAKLAISFEGRHLSCQLLQILHVLRSQDMSLLHSI